MGFYKVIEIKFPKKIMQKWKEFQNPKKKRKRKQQIKKMAILMVVLFLAIQGGIWIKKSLQQKKVVDVMTSKQENKSGAMLFLKETIPSLNGYTEQKDFGRQEKEEKKEQEAISYANLDQIKGFEDLKKYMYTIDETAYVTEEDLNLEQLLGTDVRADLYGEEPKILIFHTHSQEAFSDSQPGVEEDTIVGVGQTLGEILAEKYGVCVVHDIGQYDLKNGELDRSNSYETMEKAIQKVLKKYPSIEVCIDLHRDGVEEGVSLTTEINGKSTAQLMFFNGICRLNENGMPKETKGLENQYIPQNLAFSFHMQAMANTLYPGMMRKIYIKPYRYSLNMRPLSLLVEVGANTNTIEEAKNAMEPLAEILIRTLDGERT